MNTHKSRAEIDEDAMWGIYPPRRWTTVVSDVVIFTAILTLAVAAAVGVGWVLRSLTEALLGVITG